MRCNPLKLRVVEVTTAGTDVESPDFFSGSNLNGELAYGVVLGISETTFRTLPPAQDHKLLRLTVDVLAPAPEKIPLIFEDGLGIANARVNNVLADSTGQSVHPALVEGSITVLGEDIELSMTVPRLDGLTAVLPAPGGDVNVILEPRYDARGKFVCGGTCTVDGSPVILKGTIKNRHGAWVYKLAIARKEEKIKCKIKGDVSSDRADFSYSGPKGKAVLAGAPVTLVAKATDLSARFNVSPQVDAKGKVSGAGTIVSGLGNDSEAPGVLKGKRKGDKLSLSLTSGRQKLAFKGILGEGEFTGTLKVKLPPEKGVRTGFSMPNLFELPAQ
jgi:hypothetical protein